MASVFGLVVIHVTRALELAVSSIRVGGASTGQALFLSAASCLQVKDLRGDVAVPGALQERLRN